MLKNSRVLYILTLLVSFCSIVYEFSLAQSLSSVLGNSVLRYNITIGLYVFALGFGAFLYSKFNHLNRFNLLYRIEILLSLIGGTSPILIIFSEKLFINTSYILLLFVTHLFIILIGLLSGFELPILMNMGEEDFSDTSSNLVLAIDYLGTFLGVVLFTFVLLRYLGVFGLTFLTALINSLCSLFLANSKIKFIISLSLVFFFIILLFFHLDVSSFIIHNIYLGDI